MTISFKEIGPEFFENSGIRHGEAF
ncbi:hypothetical protein OIHEL45_03250 [Sulfitobacter indolifex HEL-45]|uniref:Uncharacterized protein n=1 Tax=Sulfitobacter indolifex HEL-45 TaxID=391624 RepID=A0ABM9X8F2_9RHOB|nr:hypothetical protein OIHEL45_03250 [Sulfitobacter indolifex HEL-45]